LSTALTPFAASPSELQAVIEAERAGEPFVVFRGEDASLQIVQLGELAAPVTLGRRSRNAIALVWDDRASRVHAELSQVAGEWTVSDDGLSRNGTFVNGERIGGRRRLRDGDTLRVGATTLIFRKPGEGASAMTVPGDSVPGAPVLSDAQRRVLALLCHPYKHSGGFATPATNAEIAAAMHLSTDAVKGHMRALFRKFAIPDLPHNQKRMRLVEAAFHAGAVTEAEL
jgi:pSer/pThr/pTyr-binding forkhead associated (FHA) protein